MNTAGLALWGCATATVFALAAGGCGGAIAPDIGDGGPGSSSGGAGSSSGTSSGGGSSSGIGSSSSSGGGSTSSGGTSSGGISGSSSSGSGSGGSSSGIIGSSSGPNGSMDFEECIGGTLCSTPQSDFYAAFTQAPSQTTGCTITTTNGCSLYECTSTGTTAYVSAGILTISGGSIGGSIPVTPVGGETYNYTTQSLLFTPGQSLTVSASGATVPAFGPISVLAPSTAMMVSPQSPYSVSLKGDLGVQWTGGAAGNVFVLEGITQNNQTYFLCEWDAAMGKNLVPQATLSGIGSGSGYLIYGQYASTTFTVGTYTVYDSALSYGGGTATFQ